MRSPTRTRGRRGSCSTSSTRRGKKSRKPSRSCARCSASNGSGHIPPCYSLSRMKKFAGVLAVVGMASLARAETLHEQAMRIHKSAIVVDTHEDVPEKLEEHWVDLGVRNTVGHIDIPRWREGGVTAPFLAAYVNAE